MHGDNLVPARPMTLFLALLVAGLACTFLTMRRVQPRAAATWLWACLLALDVAAQAPASAVGGSRPKSVGAVIENLATTGRSAGSTQGDRDPLDVDAKAKAQRDAGLKKFYDATDDAKRAAGIRLIEEAIAREPRMPSAYDALFLYYVTMQRNVDKAISHLESGAKHCPESPSVRTHLGNAYSAAGRPNDAITQFSSALKLAPVDLGRASLHYNIGNQHQKLGSIQSAIDSWRSALEVDSKHFNARRNLVIGYYQSGSVEAARKEARRLVELDPGGTFGQWAREALQRM